MLDLDCFGLALHFQIGLANHRNRSLDPAVCHVLNVHVSFNTLLRCYILSFHFIF